MYLPGYRDGCNDTQPFEMPTPGGGCPLVRISRDSRALVVLEKESPMPALVSLPPNLESIEAVWHVRRAIDRLFSSDEAAIVRL